MISSLAYIGDTTRRGFTASSAGRCTSAKAPKRRPMRSRGVAYVCGCGVKAHDRTDPAMRQQRGAVEGFGNARQSVGRKDGTGTASTSVVSGRETDASRIDPGRIRRGVTPAGWNRNSSGARRLLAGPRRAPVLIFDPQNPRRSPVRRLDLAQNHARTAGNPFNSRLKGRGATCAAPMTGNAAGARCCGHSRSARNTPPFPAR